MIAYLIPKSRRYNEIVIVDVGDPVPRLLKTYIVMPDGSVRRMK